jgi:hypothetical protein
MLRSTLLFRRRSRLRTKQATVIWARHRIMAIRQLQGVVTI